MNRLRTAMVLSLLFHGLLLAPLVIWESPGKRQPLGGSGGGRGITVEIIGGGGAARSSRLAGPASRRDKLKPRRASSGSSAPASQQASLSGPGTGPGDPGIGSGPAGGTNPVLAEIRARVERAKRYPLLARQSGITGTAWVRFEIDGSGRPQNVEIQKSSGRTILDDEALATIKRGAPYPAYSESLAISIRFELKD